MAVRKYMVVRYGTSKKTNELYCQAYRMREDEKNGNFGYLDENDVYYLDDMRPLGSVVAVELTETVV